MQKELAASYTVKCSGPYLHQETVGEVEASVSVFKDGLREVGCPLIDTVGIKSGTCLNVKSADDPTIRKNCVHLYPVTPPQS